MREAGKHDSYKSLSKSHICFRRTCFNALIFEDSCVSTSVVKHWVVSHSGGDLDSTG